MTTWGVMWLACAYGPTVLAALISGVLAGRTLARRSRRKRERIDG